MRRTRTKKFVRNIFLALVLCLGIAPSAFADDFMGLPIEDSAAKDERSLPTWIFGGGASLAYYLRGIDGTVDLDLEYRAHRYHAFGIHGGLSFAGEFIETGLDWRWYFKGALMQSGHDDFLHFSASLFCMEHFEEWFFSPALEFGYGRDILFFKKSDLLGRIEVQAAYLLGEPVTKMNDRLLVDQSGRLIVNIRFSLLLF